MKLRVFSVYDGKIAGFMRPFFDAHLGNALRSFEEACKEPTSPFAKYPSDFVLYEIGSFDDEKGVLESHSPIQLVATAVEYVSKSMPGIAVNKAWTEKEMKDAAKS